jgi:L-2,4-diaminobutyric acid acetyltransferase
VIVRAPTAADAAPMWRLLGRIGELERNSCYAYLLLCSDFADTCLVAEEDGHLLGFVLAYRPPARPDEVFVWQVGVALEARGAGLGGRLLDALLAAPGCATARFLTATVAATNAPSRRLFGAVARRRGAAFEVGPRFDSSLFADPHEAEDLVRIGPFRDALPET